MNRLIWYIHCGLQKKRLAGFFFTFFKQKSVTSRPELCTGKEGFNQPRIKRCCTVKLGKE